MKKTEELKKALLTKRVKTSVSPQTSVSTGSTMLNLACSGDPNCGYLKGHYYFLVGDSASGKTWLSFSAFAEAANNPAFDNYRFIFDDVENGALMDVEHYFGKKTASRIEPPALNRKKEPVNSDTVESFYYHLDDAIKDGRPFIYILDSQDSLNSDSSDKKFNKNRKASDEGEEASGSYGDGKAKYHSENLRRALAGVKRSGSILIIIGQTRDNLGFGFEKKTRSGGRSLRFYACIEIWTSVIGKLSATVRGKPRTVGNKCLAEARKNRVSGKIGKDRAAEIPIYHDLGIDDIGSCVDYLIAEKAWPVLKKGEEEDNGETKRGKRYDAKELLIQGNRKQLIRQIEEEDLEGKLKEQVEKVWKEIEDECTPKRKRRYE
jgi:hypothetical protein